MAVGFAYQALAAEPCAKVAVVIGKAVDREGSRIKTGQNIPKGTEISTGPTSLVKIVLNDDSILDLGSSSQLKISACHGKNWATKINLEMERGNLRALVNKSPKKKREEFLLKTLTSTLAVRGTEFFVNWQQDSQGQVVEQIGVSEGQLEVTSLFDPGATPIAVNGGAEFLCQGKVERLDGDVKVEPSAPPRVDQFTAEEQRQAEQSSKIESRVFENAIDLSTEKPDSSNGPKVDNPDKSENNLNPKMEKVVAFIQTTTEQKPEKPREIASDSNPSAVQPAPPSLPAPKDPTSSGATPGNGFGGNSFLNNPIPVSIPAVLSWGVQK